MSSNTHGRVAILLLTSGYGDRDKLRPDGPLGSYDDVLMFNVLKTRKKNRRKCEMGKNVTSHGKTYTNGYPLKRVKLTAEKRVSNGHQER